MEEAIAGVIHSTQIYTFTVFNEGSPSFGAGDAVGLCRHSPTFVIVISPGGGGGVCVCVMGGRGAKGGTGCAHSCTLTAGQRLYINLSAVVSTVNCQATDNILHFSLNMRVIISQSNSTNPELASSPLASE